MYNETLRIINNRLKLIDQISLEDDLFNEEWRELCNIRNSLYTLIKIQKRQQTHKSYEKETK